MTIRHVASQQGQPSIPQNAQEEYLRTPRGGRLRHGLYGATGCVALWEIWTYEEI